MLHASVGEPLPFAPNLQVRSFAIERPEGNLLIYGAPHVPDLGGITAHYLNHWHEASFATGDAPRFVHERDADHVPGARTFAQREILGGDFEIIPTPGHTPGATAFLWNRHLFTGDTVFLRDGEWVAAVLDDSDPDAYIERRADQNNPRAAHSARGEPCGRIRPVTSARRGSSRPATTSTQSA
jgi:hypothetical protein